MEVDKCCLLMMTIESSILPVTSLEDGTGSFK